jgi:hypothetical protein
MGVLVGAGFTLGVRSSAHKFMSIIISLDYVTLAHPPVHHPLETRYE